MRTNTPRLERSKDLLNIGYRERTSHRPASQIVGKQAIQQQSKGEMPALMYSSRAISIYLGHK